MLLYTDKLSSAFLFCLLLKRQVTLGYLVTNIKGEGFMQNKLGLFLIATMLFTNISGLMGITQGGGILGEKSTVVKTPELVKTEEIDNSAENDIDEEAEENEILEKETKENEEIMENEETIEETEKNCIYNVSFPTGSTAHLDPDNLSGKGQIFSDKYEVENYGNTDIAIKIKNIDAHYWLRSEVYELTDEEVSDGHSGVKKLNINIVWKNEKENTEEVLNVVEGTSDEYVLFLRASEYDENGDFIELNEGSKGVFYFTGSLKSDPWTLWEDDKITICFDYEIINVEEEKEESVEEEKEQEETESAEEEKQEESESTEEEVKQGESELVEEEAELEERKLQKDFEGAMEGMNSDL